jgi:hypothetical protein
MVRRVLDLSWGIDKLGMDDVSIVVELKHSHTSSIHVCTFMSSGAHWRIVEAVSKFIEHTLGHFFAVKELKHWAPLSDG